MNMPMGWDEVEPFKVMPLEPPEAIQVTRHNAVLALDWIGNDTNLGNCEARDGHVYANLYDIHTKPILIGEGDYLIRIGRQIIHVRSFNFAKMFGRVETAEQGATEQ